MRLLSWVIETVSTLLFAAVAILGVVAIPIWLSSTLLIVVLTVAWIAFCATFAIFVAKRWTKANEKK